MVRFRRRLLRLLVPLTIVAVLGAAATLWLDQQSARARLAEAQLQPVLQRAEAAEARAARAEASLTAIASQRQAEAAATATAVAVVIEPERALQRALGRLFAVFQDPTGREYDQLGDAFGPNALPAVRAEADYLRITGRHLGGVSTFSVDAAPPTQLDPEHAEVRTHERWVYDERDEADRRQRCFTEDSDQTYVMRRAGQSWIVDQVTLAGTHRSDCPS
jgi:type II secretory pathway pseudopilin PulG